MKSKECRELIKEMNEFLEGKNPKHLRVFKFRNDGKQIEIINQLELYRGD